MDNEDRILEAIGGIKVSVDVITNDISQIKHKQDMQSDKLNQLSTSLELYKQHGVVCLKEFSDINRKLEKDYITINRLDAEAQEMKIISKYKTNTLGGFKTFLVVVSTIVGLLIGINQLISIKSKVSLDVTPAVYSMPIDTIRADSTSPWIQ